MRKLILATMALIAMTTFLSCSDDNEDDPGAGLYVNPEGMLKDGHGINGIGLYCLEKGGNVYHQFWFDYYKKVKTLNDFSQMDLRILMNEADGWTNQGDPDFLRDIEIMETEYYKQKTVFLQKAYRQYESYARNGWPCFWTAYLNGKATLVCDKDLYGEKAGSDLSEHFGIRGRFNCIPQGIENPILKYNFCDVQPEIMSDYFIDKSWIQTDYFVYPLSNPSEKYEELTFTLTIPMILEHSREYIVSKINGLNKDLRRTEEVFTTKCTISNKT